MARTGSNIHVLGKACTLLVVSHDAAHASRSKTAARIGWQCYRDCSGVCIVDSATMRVRRDERLDEWSVSMRAVSEVGACGVGGVAPLFVAVGSTSCMSSTLPPAAAAGAGGSGCRVSDTGRAPCPTVRLTIAARVAMTCVEVCAAVSCCSRQCVTRTLRTERQQRCGSERLLN